MFENDAQKAEAVANLHQLLATPGWQLLVKLMDSDLQTLRTELEDSDNEDGKDPERKIRIKLMKELKELPQRKMKEWSDQPEPETDDPYPTVKDLK